MTMTRRSLVASALAAPAVALPALGRTLPLRNDFAIDGVFLNAAFTHPISAPVIAAMKAYVDVRANEPRRLWVTQEVENGAAALFAKLVNAAPDDIAAVPSTMVGENLICAALDLRPGTRVVTDAFHYFGSLAMYGEMRKAGIDVVVVPPRDNRIALEDLDDAITPQTRLVAVSLVSSHSGFVHDLKEICTLAHSRGALVYADIIQAAGAIPVDVKASGVDFACSGGYKWLQGDFGAAFLYVKPDARDQVRRTQTGWRQVQDYKSHAFPHDPPGPPEGTWRMAPAGAEGVFEVASPSHAALWSLRASIAYVLEIGVDAIDKYRRPMMHRLYTGMLELGYAALTPEDQNSPIATFARATVSPAVREKCKARNITVGIGANFIRVSPSIFNTTDDIELLLEAVRV